MKEAYVAQENILCDYEITIEQSIPDAVARDLGNETYFGPNNTDKDRSWKFNRKKGFSLSTTVRSQSDIEQDNLKSLLRLVWLSGSREFWVPPWTILSQFQKILSASGLKHKTLIKQMCRVLCHTTEVGTDHDLQIKDHDIWSWSRSLTKILNRSRSWSSEFGPKK